MSPIASRIMGSVQQKQVVRYQIIHLHTKWDITWALDMTVMSITNRIVPINIIMATQNTRITGAPSWLIETSAQIKAPVARDWVTGQIPTINILLLPVSILHQGDSRWVSLVLVRQHQRLPQMEVVPTITGH